MMEKQKIIKNILPHVIAILAMIVLPLIYASPILSGKVIYQNDILQGQGGSSELIEYRDKTGDEALWTGTMFSGMPTFQMAISHTKNVGYHLNRVIRRLIDGPISLVFACSLGAYILFISLGVKPYLSLICALGFGFSTFNIVSLEAGHNSKINALAYMPGVLAGIILAYRGKIWLGVGLTALFLNLHLVANHFQITYYLIFAILFYVGFVFYEKLKAKELKQFINASILLVIAALLASAPNVSRLWTTYEYANETIRGGKSELTKPETDKKSTGLDKDYAMSWSYGKMESMTLLIPYFRGGASNEKIGRKSELAKAGLPIQNLDQVPTYWGDQPFTSGPVYLGAIYCFLFVFAFLILKGPLRWWLLTFSIFVLVLSWGKNFAIISDFLFYNLPLYNKFRTPSMILGVLQFTFPFASALALQKVLEAKENKEELIKALLKATAIVGGIVLLFGLVLSGSYDYNGAVDARLQSAGWPMEALKADRASLLRSDSIRSLVLILLSATVIYFFLKDKIKELTLIAILGVLMLGDLWMVDKRYLNEDNFESPRRMENIQAPTTADLKILEDKDMSYRVFNLTKSPFNDAITSYHHNSIGGYHAGKLYRYQELIERHLSRNNMAVLNMLNTKYFIVADKQSNQPQVRQNPGALGNCWIADSVVWVENADEEMAKLGNFDPSKEAIIDKRYKEDLEGYTFENSSENKIELEEYSPNKMKYKAEINTKNALAVFSEIYYEGGDHDWKMRIDNEDQEHIRVDYLLRAAIIPVGVHEVEFSFEPKSWYLGNKISMISSILLSVFILGAFFLHFKEP